MDDSGLRHVLETRARALARRPKENGDSDTEAVVALTTAGERYAVDASYVVEVGHAGDITPVPGLPAHWAGLVNVRGSMWPVLDLQIYLGVASSEAPSERSSLVFVSQDGVTVGLLSESAPEFRRVATTSLRSPVSTGDSNVITGVTPDFLSILDVEQLINDTRTATEPLGG